MKLKKIKSIIMKIRIYINKPNNKLSIGIRNLNLNNIKLHYGNIRIFLL